MKVRLKGVVLELSDGSYVQCREWFVETKDLKIDKSGKLSGRFAVDLANTRTNKLRPWIEKARADIKAQIVRGANAVVPPR